MNIENDPTARPQVPQMPSGAIDRAAIERRARKIRGEALGAMIDMLVKGIARKWSSLRSGCTRKDRAHKTARYS
jgi:hypothetical protein